MTMTLHDFRYTRVFRFLMGPLTSVVLVMMLTGCGPSTEHSAEADQQQQEIARLEQENQALPGAQRENEELQQLQKENQELPKLRSQYQEMGRLKKENDQLSQQLAKLRPAGAVTHDVAATAAQPGAATPPAPAQTDPAPAPETAANQARELQEGDEIWIEPRYLKVILPEFDWDKLERTEPVTIRSLLEKDGLVLTNTAQLHEMGLTNFVIKRPPEPVQPEGQQAAP